MKFYTLDFDCNQPTVQQVNVPTNTDYKVGIKVIRNGEIQNLSPDSVTLGGLSADAEKTNGYVTFTLSAGDNASYTSKKLDIEKGYDFNDTVWNAGGPAVSGQKATFSAEDTAEKAGLAGLKLRIDDIQWGYNNTLTTQATPADITDWNEAKTYYGGTWVFFKWPNGRVALEWISANPTAFAWFSEDGTQSAYVDNPTIDPRWVLAFGGNGSGARTNVGKYWVVALKFKIGTPWSADFKLNTNIFKSQQGDIADGVEDASTAKLSGKFADGTDFDYNLVIV